MELIQATQYLWGHVRTTDTPEVELLEKAKVAGYDEATAKKALELMLKSSSIVKGRAEGTYQRWHGEIATTKGG